MCSVIVAALGFMLSSGIGATGDVIADAAAGQSSLTANIPNQPSGLPTAAGLALSNAVHCAIARDGRLYVSDSENNRVLSWPSATSFISGQSADLLIGQPDFSSAAANNGGISASSLWLPQGLAVDENQNLWVADAFNSRVLKYVRPDLTDSIADLVVGQSDFVSGFENAGQGGSGPDVALPDSLQFPGRVLVRDNELYIADSGNSRVLRYPLPAANRPTADRVFGQYGNFYKRAKNNDGNGQNGFNASPDNLLNPIGIALDGAGRLYIADWANHRILRFDDPLESTTADAVYGQPDLNSRTFDNGGPTTGLQFPIDLFITACGQLLVADSGNNRVLVYDLPLTSTAPTRVFGQLGSFATDTPNHGLGPGATDAEGLFGPTGAAVDEWGNLYIVDTNNHRALRFDIEFSPQVSADFNCDGHVNTNDYDHFKSCSTRATVVQTDPICMNADLDHDADVDMDDFGLFQRCYSGEEDASDPGCLAN